jgi:hypothetical protein
MRSSTKAGQARGGDMSLVSSLILDGDGAAQVSRADDPLGWAEEMNQRFVAGAEGARRWYFERRRLPRRLAQLLRGLAASLAAFGFLVPIVQPLAPQLPLGTGYAALAAGGALLFLNRTLGLSSAWARYVKAALQIETLLQTHLIAWRAAIAAARRTPGDEERLYALLTQQVSALGAIVQTETETWVLEFNRDLGALEQSVSDRAPTVVRRAGTG